MKKKKGFTLAEILITLGIIGVVAALLFPAINNAQPNQEMVMLKKVYYNTTRIVSELINDEDFYPEREEDNQSGFSNTEIRDILGGEQEARYHGFTLAGDSKFCALFAIKLNTTQGGDPNNLCNARVALNAGGNFETPDGVAWSMPVSNFHQGSDAQDSEYIFVDVNGPDRGTNCTLDSQEIATEMDTDVCSADVGPDRFAIEVGRMGNVNLPARISQIYVSSSRVNRHFQDFAEELQEQGD